MFQLLLIILLLYWLLLFLLLAFLRFGSTRSRVRRDIELRVVSPRTLVHIHRVLRIFRFQCCLNVNVNARFDLLGQIQLLVVCFLRDLDARGVAFLLHRALELRYVVSRNFSLVLGLALRLLRLLCLHLRSRILNRLRHHLLRLQRGCRVWMDSVLRLVQCVNWCAHLDDVWIALVLLCL